MDSDINYIIQKSLNGDKNYQEILLKRLTPLIFKNIYKYYKPSDFITEDLLQEGYIVILQSLNEYDPGRNVHFLYYVKIRLHYFYINYYKRTTKNNSLSIDLLKSRGREIKSKNPLQIDLIIYKEEKNALYRCIENLSIEEHKIVSNYYFEKMSMKDIAKNLKIPYPSCRNLKRAALKKLFNCLH